MRNEPVLPSLTQPMTKRHPAPQEVEPRGRKQGGKRSPTCYGSPRLFLIPSLRPALNRPLPPSLVLPAPGRGGEAGGAKNARGLSFTCSHSIG